jgi:hypothetical protein
VRSGKTPGIYTQSRPTEPIEHEYNAEKELQSRDGDHQDVSGRSAQEMAETDRP